MTLLKSQSWEEAEPGSWAAESALRRHCLRQIEESALLWGPIWLPCWEQLGQGGRGPAGRGAAAGLEKSEQIQARER